MAPARPALDLTTDFDPQTGQVVAVAPGVARVTAPNRGPFTFTGTNSFLVGHDRLILIDPGPRDGSHLAALRRAIDGRPVEAIVITHTHLDHSGLARRLKAMTGAPLWFGGRHRFSRPPRWGEHDAFARACDWKLEPDRTIGEGDRLAIDGMSLTVIATPGHCANHLAFGVSGTPYLLSGDHVMGWSSTLVAPPDGSMADYLRSLEKVIVAPFSRYLPAHGGPIEEGRKFARALLAHREERNGEIRLGVASGANTAGRLVRRIYQDLPARLRPAARKTIEAHLDYLVDRGELTRRPGLFGASYRRQDKTA